MDVSVLMPVYNGERYVAQAIDSILNQTHRSFEFVIINDGSTDGTQEILDNYAERDHRIRVFSQANKGQPATLNRGLQLATYDWVAIIDHDDISLPHRLETQLETIAQFPEVRVVGAHGFYINAVGDRLRRVSIGPTTVAAFREQQALGGRVSLFHTSVLMHRRTIIDLGGYDSDFGPTADSELWTRVAEHHLVLAVAEPLVLYRVHRESMSFQQMLHQRELLGWTDARRLARHAKQPIPTLEEYRKQCRSVSRLRRVRHLRHQWSWYLRTQRKYAVADGKYGRALAFGLCSAIVAPINAIRAGLRWVSAR